MQAIDEQVKAHKNPYCEYWNGSFILHAQVGLADDQNVTPGTRIPIGEELPLYEHMRQAGKFHKFFPSGTGDIFPFDMTSAGNPEAVCLMVYTDNFRKFNYDSRKIACYYGIAPFGKDSGTSVHTDPHVHYMANRQIKAMLTQAALAAVNFNQGIASYYSRLIARGKKKQVALNNVKNKLVHIATAMVKNKQVFDKNYKISA